MSNLLPTYERPPLVETILGVQFDPLRSFRNAHLGIFWKRLGPSWPFVEDAPPLEPQFERFTEEDKWKGLGLSLSLSQVPQGRMQIRNSSKDRMIQVQNGRLIFNWLRQENAKYPRYEAIRDEFKSYWDQFVAFVSEEGIGEVKPNQWEVTYLNHIPRTTVWNSVHDWDFLGAIARTTSLDEVVALESLAGQMLCTIPENRGRLHVSWQHGRTEASSEVMVLNLTARGPVQAETNGTAAPFSGLDLGRRVIVRAFEKLMSKEANTFWGLKHAGG